MCSTSEEDWVLVPSCMQRTPSKALKDQKDVKHQPSVPPKLPLPGQSPVLPPSVLRPAAARPSPIGISAPMADVKDPVTPPTPPSPPPPTRNVPIPALQKLCRFDLSKLDPTDPVIREELTKLANLGISRSIGGFKPQLKHKYGTLNSIQLGVLVTDGKGNDPFPSPLSADISTATVAANCGFSLPGYILEGDGIVNRLGRTIRPVRLNMRFTLTWSFNSTAIQQITEGFGVWRMIIFKDKMSMGPAPTNAPATQITTDDQAVWVATNPSATQQNPIVMQFNPLTHGYRYTIYHDKSYRAPSNATTIMYTNTFNTWAGQAVSTHDIHIDLKDHGLITYGDDATAAPTLIVKNDLYIMYGVDLTLGGGVTNNAYPYVDMQYDFVFIDN